MFLTCFTNNLLEKSSFTSALLFSDHENFEKHLQARSDEIKSVISSLSSHAAKCAPEVSELQSRLAKKLAEEKVAIEELEKTLADKQDLEERLEAASLRYMVAEKKLDRARSLTVAKLEKQYLLGAQKPAGDTTSVKREESGSPNGVSDSGDRAVELEEARNKAQVIVEKQKEQLEKLEAENLKLTGQLTEASLKVSDRYFLF